MSHLNIEHSFKSSFGEDGFVNIGTGFKFLDSEYFSLLGETYWAFTHGRGAYAEGLFGARVNYKIFFLEAQVGAGAGGGFNLWDAAALAFVNPGLEIPLKEGMYINARANRTVYSSQDFPKWGYQLPFVKY